MKLAKWATEDINLADHSVQKYAQANWAKSLPQEPGRNDKRDDEVGGRGSEEQESYRW